MENQDKAKKSDILYRNYIYPHAESIFSFNPKSIEDIKDDCIVVLDTNSLLVPYMTGKESLEQISKIYKLLVDSKRLVIPGQSAREFAEHRVTKLKELYQQVSRKKTNPALLGSYPLLEGLVAYQKAIEFEKKLNDSIREYNKLIDEILDNIRQWYWNDPVSKLYSSLFARDVVLDIKIEKEELQKRIKDDFENKIPPGYKDANKPDGGVGDVIIWYTILELGKVYNKSVLFVSSDQKPDWWSQSENRPLYPRYELVEEFRRASDGQSFHIIKFSELLNFYGASKEVVEEIRKEEVQSHIENSRQKSSKADKADLILLSSEIEKELRNLLGSMGLIDNSRNTFLSNIKLLEPYGFTELEIANEFWKIRNRVVHGQEADLDDISWAINAGILILEKIQAIPHEIHIVYHSGISVYSDRECNQIRGSVNGVILETKMYPGDAFVSLRVVPTTCTHFLKGKIAGLRQKNRPKTLII
jgi:hypothetical protein